MQRSNGTREAHPARFEIDPNPRRLRESLRQLRDMWRWLEPESARRVRLLLIEIVGRSADPRRQPQGAISLSLTLRPDVVRIEASGPGLLTPSQFERPNRESERLFPQWVIEDLADRWAIDSPADDPAVWFEIDRRATPWRASAYRPERRISSVADDVAALQLSPEAISDDNTNRQAREELDRVADHLEVERQTPDSEGYVEFPVTPQDLERALDYVTPRWREIGLYHARPPA
jgi:hypothetical protein